jgi:hypothetical protein
VPPTEEVYQPGPLLGARRPVGGAGQPIGRDAGSRLAIGEDAAPSGARLKAGESCFDGNECESGVCEGEGCRTNQPGVCVAPGRVCKGPEESFCGCDGETFRAPHDCPGQPFARRGACNAR